MIAKATPDGYTLLTVPATHADRCGDFLHQHELAAAEITPVGLQQDRFLVPTRSETGAVVEDAAVAAVGGVPQRIGALRLVVFEIVGGQEAVAIDRGAEDDAAVEGEHRLLDGRQDAVGERHEAQADAG